MASCYREGYFCCLNVLLSKFFITRMKDPYQKFHFGSIKSKLTRFGLVVLVKQQIADMVKMLISSV